MKGLFNGSNGNLSSKRVMGVIGAIICLGMFIAMFFTEAKQISDTLLMGMFGLCTALIGIGVFEKK